MSTAHISIGSNLGDRAALIERAVAAISARFAVTAVSRPVESEPWGYSSPHPFINVGVNIEIGPGMTPETLLDILLEIQNSIDSSAHRNTDGSYADRAIDIDIIAMGDQIRRSPVPSPRPPTPIQRSPTPACICANSSSFR